MQTTAGRRIAIIGGGAAGYFAAINAAEALNGTTPPDGRDGPMGRPPDASQHGLLQSYGGRAQPTGKPHPAPQPATTPPHGLPVGGALPSAPAPAEVTIYELSRRTLAKVKISGGGRCNVTHHCFDPTRLATHYPRGGRELRAAFHRWQPQDTIAWFAARGVTLKAEPDGRMFPTTDDSQTIIDCFERAARAAGVTLRLGCGLQALDKAPDGSFRLTLSDGSEAQADRVCVAVGSLKTAPLSIALEKLGHTLEPPVPSLFAFDVRDPRLEDLSGLSVPNATVRLAGGQGVTLRPFNATQGRQAQGKKAKPALSQTQGPVLITHKGLSGPGILRLSAWEARTLHAANYQFEIAVNWLPELPAAALDAAFARQRKNAGKALVRNRNPFEKLPRRLWERLVAAAGVDADTAWAQLPKAQEQALIAQLTDARFAVTGKTTNKDEFVTCGGVRLKEVDFRTMESRLVPGLHFAGECLDLDGITGGFNFQAAWTTGRLAALAMATR